MAATAIGNIFIGMTVDTRGARSFTSAASMIGRDSERIRTSLSGTQRSVSALRASMSTPFRHRLFGDILRQASLARDEISKLRVAMMSVAALTGGSAAGAFGGAFILFKADEANRLQNQLRTVTDSEENLVAVRERLFQISQLTRSELSGNALLYARLARAAKEFGSSQTELLRVTETIQKAFAVGGASQQEAWGGAIQLSQGIASDRFGGEEYRSVSENAPVLIQEMARNLGVTIGKLREMAHAGELTGKVVVEAILGASAAIDESFNKTVVTVGQGITKVGNAFLMYVGNVDSSLGVTQKLAAALGNLAEHMDEIAPLITMIAGGGIAAFAGRSLGAGAAGGINAIVQSWQTAKNAAQDGLEIALQRTRAVQAEVGINKDLMAAERLKNAEAYRAMTQQGATQKQMIAAQKMMAQSHAQMIMLRRQGVVLAEAELLAQKQLVVASQAAARQMSIMRTAGTWLKGIGGGLFNLVGGLPGILMTGAIVGLGAYAKSAAESAKRTSDLKEELHSLGLISDEVAGVTDKVAASLENASASAIRNKLRDIADELERMKGSQNIFDQIFNYDPQMLGNMIQVLDRVQAGYTADGRGVNTYSPDQMRAARMMREIVVAAQDGSATVEVLQSKLDTLGRENPDMLPWLDKMVEDLRKAIPYMDGLQTRAEKLASDLKALNDSGTSTLWIENLIAQQEALEAAQSGAEAVRNIANEQIRVLGLSEEEARLEKVMADLRKDAIKVAGDEAVIQEAVLRDRAKAIIAAEDEAALLKKSREETAKWVVSMEQLHAAIQKAGNNAQDQAIANDMREWVQAFSRGKLSAAELKSRLEGIKSMNVSASMIDLANKAQDAIPVLSTILRLLNMMPGSNVGAAVQSASDRARAYGAARGVTAKWQSDMLGEASMTSDQAAAEAEIQSLMRGPKDGVGMSRADAEAFHAELERRRKAVEALEESQKSGVKTAEKYAEGMADLARELAAAPLDPFLKEVLSAAEGMGIATDELDEFIAAVSSGSIDDASEKFRKIAESMRGIKAINVVQDLRLEADMFGMSAWDREIADLLRENGIEAESFYGKLIDGQVRWNHAIKTGADLANDVFGGIAKDLMNGVSLTDALNSAVGRLRDRLLDMGMELMTNAAFGFISQMLGGLFGGGGGVSGGFVPGLTGPRLFDTGGYTGPGARNQPAGVVHKGEVVWSQDDVARAGGVGVVEALRRGMKGFASGGFVSGGAAVASSVPTYSGGGSLEVRLINESGQPMQAASANRKNEGGIDIIEIVMKAWGDGMASGRGDNLMGGLYGLRRRGA